MSVGLAVLILGSACIVKVNIGRTNNDSEASSFSSTVSKHSPSPPAKTAFFATLRIKHKQSSICFILLLATFLSQLPTGQALVMRYMTNRFSWPIAKTNFLMSLMSGIKLILFIAILPFISRILTSPMKPTRIFSSFNFNLSASLKDLLLARISLMLQVLGALFLALSAFSFTPSGSDQETSFPITLAIGGLVIYSFSLGYTAFCRALITTLVDEQHIARLHSVICVSSMIGSFITIPGVAWLYAWGISLVRKGLGNGYLGLPFYGVVLFSMTVGSGVIWFPKLRTAI